MAVQRKAVATQDVVISRSPVGTFKATVKRESPYITNNFKDLFGGVVKDMQKAKPGLDLQWYDEDGLDCEVTDWCPFGSVMLDLAVSGGRGAPFGRIIEIYGPESNGKTTVAAHLIREAIKIGALPVYMDTELAGMGRERLIQFGVDLEQCLYCAPETCEDVFEFVEVIVDKVKKVDPNRKVVIVWDSVAGTPTKAECAGEYDDQHMASQARVLSQSFRKIRKYISNQQILFVCINQLREKMNVKFGKQTQTPGGKALKFHASVRVEIVKLENLRKGEKDSKKDPHGIKCQATVEKNKVFPPFRKAIFEILFDGGIDDYGTVIDMLKKAGYFGKSAGYYEVDGMDKKLRKDELKQLFIEDNEWYLQWRDLAVNELGGMYVETVVPEPGDEGEESGD